MMESEGLAERWVAALRDGRYKQTTGCLRSPDDSYCCLSVLADISRIGEWGRDDAGRYEYRTADGAYLGTGSLCNCDEVVPFLTGPLSQHRLIKMNDDGKTFLEIADFVEENL